ncbi:Oxidoreductase [Candidozyma auris]|uniref:Mitochondrial intermembrane space import and assembly protein 40 n=2 Tax=Candidozyma auris TaxID=498019 RepID=A0AB36W4Y5_CANAR|nr:hypothetical protein B9J08_003261 [[Candida] auris]PIS53652.1 hypothetical protein CJI97_003336 [[Candida] auris]QWW21987.1 hypothetical protein CA7LBN_000733 [[Candida] auris]
MFKTCITTSLRRGVPIARRFASTSSHTSTSWKAGLAPKVAFGASLVAGAIMFPITQVQNDVSEKAKELVNEAAEQTTAAKEEIKDAVKSSGDKTSDDKTASSNEPEEGQAAFNPETGEINWDCPCLGGMAHGPCGEEFKEAFSCFVYSETEPKGIDCIKKFEAMRTCFRQHPEHYKEELYDDEEVSSTDDDITSAGAAAGATDKVTIDVIPSEGPSHASSDEPSAAPSDDHNTAHVIPSEGPSSATSAEPSALPADPEQSKL